jgi:hypothetical protein
VAQKEFNIEEHYQERVPGNTNIEKFKSKFGSFLKPNTYRVDFGHTKSGKRFNTSIDWEDLSMLCKGAVYSFYTFEKIEQFYNNTTFEFVNKINFEPLILRFFVDSDAKVLSFLKDWNNAQYDNETGMFGYVDDYAIDIAVTLLDKNGTEKTAVIYHGCFPISVDDIETGYDANDVIMEVNVSFRYDYPEYQF